MTLPTGPHPRFRRLASRTADIASSAGDDDVLASDAVTKAGDLSAAGQHGSAALLPQSVSFMSRLPVYGDTVLNSLTSNTAIRQIVDKSAAAKSSKIPLNFRRYDEGSSSSGEDGDEDYHGSGSPITPPVRGNRLTPAKRQRFSVTESQARTNCDRLATDNSSLLISLNRTEILNHRQMGLFGRARCQGLMSTEQITRQLVADGLFVSQQLRFACRSRRRGQRVGPKLLDKIFCCQWLSDSQVIFGTKCNSLMLYDVVSAEICELSTLAYPNDRVGDQFASNPIHAIETNLSSSVLATNGQNSKHIAFYSLPDVEPLAIGQCVVAGSRDSTVSMWRLPSNLTADESGYVSIQPVGHKVCQSADKVRSLCYNPTRQEFLAISLNGFIHCWDVCRFKQAVNTIPLGRENGGTRSLSFGTGSASSGAMLSIGNGNGVIKFFDLRLKKFLEPGHRRSGSMKQSVIKVTGHDNRSDGYRPGIIDLRNSFGIPSSPQKPAVYTHQFDASGTRLFVGGGPLETGVVGYHAALFC